MTLISRQQFIIVFVTLFSFSSFTNAADIEAGKEKAAMCQGCHGKNGNSTVSQFPILAGQTANYLEYQLRGFQSGKRSDPVMPGIVANLNKQDFKDLSAYFSSIPTKSAGADPELALKGKNKVSMCLGCHGNEAKGRGGFPRLAGQHPDYLKKQLLNFKNRSRKGGPMNSIVSSLSEQDIDEISAYLGSL
jgi:cytochrome c553